MIRDRDTMPPGRDDADADAYAQALASERDTGPLAMPGSVRLEALAAAADHRVWRAPAKVRAA